MRASNLEPVKNAEDHFLSSVARMIVARLIYVCDCFVKVEQDGTDLEVLDGGFGASLIGVAEGSLKLLSR
jgi:hypothetical protein